MTEQADNKFTIKWLGIAGVELCRGAETILFDPVFTRVSLRHVLLDKIAPDEHYVRRHTADCSHIFITHAHYDHLMDAPLVSQIAGSVIHGTANTCVLAGACGVPSERLSILKPGDTVETASFTVTALRASHIRLPGFGYGMADKNLTPPLRAGQYRMDESLVFLVQAGEYRLLIGPGLCMDEPGPVDALLCDPIYLGSRFAAYPGGLRPRVFLPIHWEDMFRAQELPLKPGIVPGFPLRRIDMKRVANRTKELGIRYFEMEPRVEYEITKLME